MNITTSGSEYHFTVKMPHTNAWLAPPITSLLRAFSAERILDIGCGNGAMLKSLADAGWTKLTGCDPSDTGIAYARSILPQAEFYQLGVYDEPALIDDGGFDAAISTEVVEHLFYPRYLPRFAHQQLKPGGLLLVSTPYHGFLKNLTLAVLDKWDAHHTPLWDGGHIKFWSRPSLTRLLEEEGFRFQRFIGCGRLPYLWKSMIIAATKI